MPRIVIQPANSEGEPRRWTLSERIVAENLDSDHYIAQLIERLAWATADAEAVEVESAGEDVSRQAERATRPKRPRGDRPAERSRPHTRSRVGSGAAPA